VYALLRRARDENVLVGTRYIWVMPVRMGESCPTVLGNESCIEIRVEYRMSGRGFGFGQTSSKAQHRVKVTVAHY
jgi:hypothetical protein